MVKSNLNPSMVFEYSESCGEVDSDAVSRPLTPSELPSFRRLLLALPLVAACSSDSETASPIIWDDPYAAHEEGVKTMIREIGASQSFLSGAPGGYWLLAADSDNHLIYGYSDLGTDWFMEMGLSAEDGRPVFVFTNSEGFSCFRLDVGDRDLAVERFEPGDDFSFAWSDAGCVVDEDLSGPAGAMDCALFEYDSARIQFWGDTLFVTTRWPYMDPSAHTVVTVNRDFAGSRSSVGVTLHPDGSPVYSDYVKIPWHEPGEPEPATVEAFVSDVAAEASYPEEDRAIVATDLAESPTAP